MVLQLGDEVATLDVTSSINAGWTSSAKVAWTTLTGEPRWGWTLLNFVLQNQGTLELTTHDKASKLVLVTEDGVLISAGSCPAPLTLSGAASQLVTGTTTTGDAAMGSCDYSRLRVAFEPGTYKLAVYFGTWPNPTGTWTGGYFQARVNMTRGSACLVFCQAGGLLFSVHRLVLTCKKMDVCTTCFGDCRHHP
jgi:hypothetical protein